MTDHYRPLSAPETMDWLNGYAWFPGAVETDHGVMVPA